MLFCNVPWCGQSSILIKGLLNIVNPLNKVHWYRDGMQDWKAIRSGGGAPAATRHL
jgi:hypothetical protein